MKTQITNISIYQNAKFLAVLVLPFSFIYALIGIIFLLTGIEELSMTAYVFISAPIWFSLIYFVIIAVGAMIYNLLASKIGGIEFELTEIKD